MKLTHENYHSLEANSEYLSVSQFHDFCGTMGYRGCEAKALAKLRGEYEEEISDSLLQGKYADAYFAGTLEQLKIAYPCLFSSQGPTKGQLKSIYKDIERTIERIEKDQYFMSALQGDRQVIMTAEFFGAKWKCAIDFLQLKKAIVDLKIMKNIRETFYVKDYGRMIWLLFWGYEEQGAIYQKIVEINTGDKLPFFLAAASKESSPDIEIVGIDDKTLSEALYGIEQRVPRVLQLKAGEIQPDRCEVCDYCRDTKVLIGPIHYSKLSE